jgi:hypothetical protein
VMVVGRDTEIIAPGLHVWPNAPLPAVPVLLPSVNRCHVWPT